MTTVGIRRFDDTVELASITSDADDVTSDVDNVVALSEVWLAGMAI